MTDAEGLGVKLEDRETVIKELKKSLKIKVIKQILQYLSIDYGHLFILPTKLHKITIILGLTSYSTSRLNGICSELQLG